MKKEISILDSTDKYVYWFIPRFIFIAKKARLTPKQLAKIIIDDGITFQKKDLLTKMFQNREVILVQDFTKMGKVKKKIISAQKIQTIEYKAWWVPGFQIPKALSSTVIDMLQKRLNMAIIEPSYSFYQSL